MNIISPRIFILCCSLVLASGCAKPSPLVWTEDYAAAVKQAQAENKKVLLNFTGSDWCVNCFRLDDEVFSKPEFADYARSHYVLVKLDFPIKKELPDAVKKQNDAMQEKYSVVNIPTIMLLDAKETALAQVVGYRGEGVAGFLDELNNPAAHKTGPLPTEASAVPKASAGSSAAK